MGAAIDEDKFRSVIDGASEAFRTDPAYLLALAAKAGSLSAKREQASAEKSARSDV